MDVDCDLFSAKYYLVWRPKIWRIVQREEAYWILFTDFDRKIFLNLSNSAPIIQNYPFFDKKILWNGKFEKKGGLITLIRNKNQTEANIQSQNKGRICKK